MLSTIIWLAIATGVPPHDVCACPSPQPAAGRQRLERSAWVFSGKVADKIEAKDSVEHASGSGWGWVYPVAVKHVWKDIRPTNLRAQRVAVTVWDECPVDIKVGIEYVFFADILGNVGRCSVPVPLVEAGELVRELDVAAGQRRKPRK